MHPEYVRAGEPWLDPRVSGHVAALATDDGLARPGVRPVGLPWQEPDGGFASVGRTDLFEAVDYRGPHRRPALRLRQRVRRLGRGPARRRSHRRLRGALRARLETGRTAALKAAEKDPGNLSDEHALTLMTAEGDLLREVCRLADDLRRETVGDDVTYVVNRNINFTNVCYVGCRFCAFAQRRTDADAYSLSLDEVADRAEEAWELGATEVCMQGGIDPELPASAYFDLVSAVKQRVPEMHVHAFSPDGDRQRHRPHRPVDRGLPDQGPRGRPRLAAGHRRGDPRRRGPLGADQGQAAHQDLGRDRVAPRTGSGCRRPRR